MTPKNQQDGGAPESKTVPPRVWVRFIDGRAFSKEYKPVFGDESKEYISYIPESSLDQAVALARGQALEEAAAVVESEYANSLEIDVPLEVRHAVKWLKSEAARSRGSGKVGG